MKMNFIPICPNILFIMPKNGKVDWLEARAPDRANTASLFHSFNHLFEKVGVVIFVRIRKTC